MSIVSDTEAVPENEIIKKPTVTVFLCANCARPGKAPTSAGRTRPAVPDFNWPFPVEQVIVPCGGRIQPEHMLKVFEAGADLVTVIACEGENCHYVEGSTRCMRRVEFIRSILEEIGLGENRLLLTYLPGSAAEDMLATTRKVAETVDSESIEAKLAEVRDQVVKTLDTLLPNPLRLMDNNEEPGNNSREGMEVTNDDKSK